MRKIKKRFSVILCTALVLCTGLMTALAPNPGDKGSVDIPILMYHSLLKDKARWNSYVISPDEFERDLIYLNESGYSTVFISQLSEYVYKGTPLPENPVVITFDDGNYNNYSYAFELLKKYNCKMVLSPIISCVQQYSEAQEISPTYGYCGWEQLKEMQTSGLVEIQNHSWDLHRTSGRLGAMQIAGESNADYAEAVGSDIQKAQNMIFDMLGVSPQCFTYPFGAYNAQGEALIKELGFVCSLSCTQKTSTVVRGNPESLYNLGRFLRDNSHSAELILTQNN